MIDSFAFLQLTMISVCLSFKHCFYSIDVRNELAKPPSVQAVIVSNVISNSKNSHLRETFGLVFSPGLGTSFGLKLVDCTQPGLPPDLSNDY